MIKEMDEPTKTSFHHRELIILLVFFSFMLLLCSYKRGLIVDVSMTVNISHHMKCGYHTLGKHYMKHLLKPSGQRALYRNVSGDVSMPRAYHGEYYQLLEYMGRTIGLNLSHISNRLLLLAKKVIFEGQELYKAEPRKWYKYSLHMVDDYHFLLIEHDRLGVPVTGGSTFRIKILGEYIRDICYYMDHFNGSYTIHCPPCVLCDRLEVYLHQHSFLSFVPRKTNDHYRPRLIIRHHLKQKCHAQLNLSLLDTCMDVDGNGEGFWIEVPRNTNVGNLYFLPYQNTSLIGWYQNYKCVSKAMDGVMMKQCLQNHQIYILGDSTLRYWVNYIIAKGNLSKFVFRKVHIHFSVGNLHFRWVDKIDSLINIIKSLPFYLHKIASNGLVTIVFNTGHWDLARGSVTDLMTRWTEALQHLQLLKKHNPYVRVIWANCEAVRDDVSNDDIRNNLNIHALNQLLETPVRHVGFEVFDRFAMNIKTIQDISTRVHMIRVLPNRTVLGTIGEITGNLLMSFLCTNITKESSR